MSINIKNDISSVHYNKKEVDDKIDLMKLDTVSEFKNTYYSKTEIESSHYVKSEVDNKLSDTSTNIKSEIAQTYYDKSTIDDTLSKLVTDTKEEIIIIATKSKEMVFIILRFNIITFSKDCYSLTELSIASSILPQGPFPAPAHLT